MLLRHTMILAVVAAIAGCPSSIGTDAGRPRTDAAESIDAPGVEFPDAPPLLDDAALSADDAPAPTEDAPAASGDAPSVALDAPAPTDALVSSDAFTPTDAPSSAPTCRNVGTRSEGWYGPDGARICFAACRGATAACEGAGTRSEGWYASTDAAGCSAGSPLIVFANCAP